MQKKDCDQYMNTIAPAQLWLGSEMHALEHLEEYLQQLFCAAQGCRHCVICRQISQKQHHAIRWITPEKSYTLDELSIIPATIAFALDAGEKFFFIIQKADFLPPTCANSLLKSLEEPPSGYHFILIANRLESILLTIRSRCTIQSFNLKSFTNNSSLFDFFTTTDSQDPLSFWTALEQSKINERQSTELLNSLLNYWINHFKEVVRDNDTSGIKDANHAIRVLKNSFARPPMPGSSKIFWKNVYLQLKHTVST